MITGHTNALGDVLPESMETLAALEGTLIFLMGLTGLEKIARRLMEAGKRPDTPAAVVSGGNSPHKAAVRGTLADIAQKTRQAGVQAPAVIVVGAVAGLDMGPTIVHPLDGACIGLVGTPVFTEKLERGFQDLGARTFRVAAARVERLPLDFPAEELCADRDKWVVLTSANGVRCFFQWLEESGVDLRRLGRCKFAVIGKATGGALRKHGIHPRRPVPGACHRSRPGGGALPDGGPWGGGPVVPLGLQQRPDGPDPGGWGNSRPGF